MRSWMVEKTVRRTALILWGSWWARVWVMVHLSWVWMAPMRDRLPGPRWTMCA